ncbi:MAG: hypothetical protein CMJ78_01965 [Planctomycetaceae bacterium]|nr:hypothetical protein [Planctomycetaceae bacterium]
MIKSLSYAVICCLLVIGCAPQANNTPPTNTASAKPKAIDWQEFLRDWKSVDKSGRLAIVEDVNPGILMHVGNQLNGKTADEIKTFFGEPDNIKKERLTGTETFQYYMGSTDEKTNFKERDILSFGVDKNGNVKGMSTQLKKIHGN